MDSGQKIDVSVVIPCLNEEESVGDCVAKARRGLHDAGRQGEVIVVDNGSRDRSAAIATAAGARVVYESKRGYGNALLCGFSQAQGNYIVMGDADDTYDFTSLAPLLNPLDTGYGMVVGNRFRGGIQEGAMPWSHRHVGTPLINLLLRLFTGARLGDSQCGLRAFTRDTWQRLNLRTEGMELASEMILKGARKGVPMTEVPITYSPRRGECKLRPFRDGWRHLRFLLACTPNYLFTGPGAVLLFLGVLTLVYSFLFPGGLAVGSLTWQPVFASAIFLATGATALSLGIVSRLYASGRGLISEDGWVRFYHRHLSLEVSLLISALLALTGIGLDAYLFTVWVSGGHLPLGLQFAALAQSSLIVGVNLALTGFVAALMDVA